VRTWLAERFGLTVPVVAAPIAGVSTTELGIDRVAHEAGLGTAAALRYHFGERVGTTPSAYRRTFRGRPLTPV
jgi:NAD(P)H-dependent flavin oxidoreductase YrpB (nitropropane dioxygenase family)